MTFTYTYTIYTWYTHHIYWLTKQSKDDLWWLYRSRDASRTLFLILFKHTHGSVCQRPWGDSLRAKERKRASKLAMRCRYVVYMSTLYDNVSCCWFVAKSIIRPSKVSSDTCYLRTLAIGMLLFLLSTHSSCIRTATQSISPYLLRSNVNELVSLSVWIIMRPIIHVGQYFITTKEWKVHNLNACVSWCVDSVVPFKTSYFFLKSKSYCGAEFLH